ncbi:MAG: selenide, water dikinase SelD [Chloracidobacterium sp.]|nr:selenide, water dikinase SelD [Chloracidobacterium sp.]MCO5332442.1 selenide, water dikinase SelD [Pyrinomonadaceae bacterium]
MAKFAPSDLAQVLSKLPPQHSDNLIVGFDKSDDAGVMRLTDGIALVQTVDFFTPVADDPRTYGRIAAINSLNDVYAMGGTPISALAIACYPQKGDKDVLAEIMIGGQEAMTEAGVIVVGGHTVDDQEIKFGYSVTGTVDPQKVITNARARPGDVLILTKAIGTGAINTAIKNGTASDAAEKAALQVMTTSASAASKLLYELGARACTDVTGFGLLGHAYELAKASGVTLNIDSKRVPLLPTVLELIAAGMLTRGDKNNRAYVGDAAEFTDDVSAEMQSALFDPQTAGGLLISFGKDVAKQFIKAVPGAVMIGTVEELGDKLIRVK